MELLIYCRRTASMSWAGAQKPALEKLVQTMPGFGSPDSYFKGKREKIARTEGTIDRVIRAGLLEKVETVNNV